jgi:hypothetical protein
MHIMYVDGHLDQYKGQEQESFTGPWPHMTPKRCDSDRLTPTHRCREGADTSTCDGEEDDKAVLSDHLTCGLQT